MNIFQETKQIIIDIIKDIIRDKEIIFDFNFDKITVEVPKDEKFGEMSTNVALIFSKPLKCSPIELAEKIKKSLVEKKIIKSVNIAKPGFLNFTLYPFVWNDVFKLSILSDFSFGKEDFGKGKKVNLEYISANPTGPLHVGHTRGAVFGDVLANLLTFTGYKVIREYYVNDAGQQIDALARSLYLRYLQLNGQEVSFDDGLYPGDYLIELALKLKEKFDYKLIEKNEIECISIIKSFAVEEIMNIIKNDLLLLNISMDNFFSEKSLYGTGKIEKAIKYLKDQDLIYEGFLEEPKGKKLESWESRKQTLFRSTRFGDDVDRPIKKSDGGWTYFAPDIAYHFDKLERDFDILIDIFGADHSGYVKRMNAAVAALSKQKVEFHIKLCQLVNLFKNGKPFKMSKRLGSYVTIKDVINEVGSECVRFMMLTRKNDVAIDFDFDQVLKMSKDNPVFYVQYAHARCCSIEEKSALNNIKVISNEDINNYLILLKTNSERNIIRKISEWPRVIEASVKNFEPHRIVSYLIELSSTFHSLQNEGKINSELKFIVQNENLTIARLLIVRSTRNLIFQGLKILGIDAIKKM